MCIRDRYTGVAWLSILHKNSTYNETQFNELNSYYEDNYNMTWYNKYGCLLYTSRCV